MSTLQAELARLYGQASEPRADAAGMVDVSGQVRALVLELARPADWTALSAVWRGVQADLDLPAPAIAVNGNDGYQLWFSLADPVTVADAHTFLEALRKRYLDAVPVARISLFPAMDEGVGTLRQAPPVPAQQPQTGHWSAFLAPDLASIFVEEPWLEREPSQEAQAGVLAGLQSIKPAEFRSVLQQLRSVSAVAAPVASSTMAPASSTQAGNLQPRQFLLDVMNNPGVELHLRIEAAKALLPYCSD
ncbi:hypothetical protein [Rhodoferax sp. GW822-FHT02A01]|uniref:hypothetical protein n=1 Tax=Rhodoferax sp. GW822-FHT02A01 TaxID=3141537 RepID=UPI00315D5D27